MTKRYLSSSTELRHVEKDVLIPKLMREKARERCTQHVDGINYESQLNTVYSHHTATLFDYAKCR